jgi:apolipoprotein N-acyltransferase
MALAMSSETRWWLGWVTLLPLFYAIRVLRPLRAFIAGAFWGGCLFASAATIGVAEFAPGPLSLALVTLVPGTYAALGAILTRQIGFSPYLLALGWMCVELAVSPVSLHRGLLAGTQGDAAFLRLLGSFTGYALVGFLVAYFNALLFNVLSQVPFGAVSEARLHVPADCGRRLISVDSLDYLSYLIRPSRPRAPPPV